MIQADDCEALIVWLRQQPLLVENKKYVLTHSGIPHIWSLEQARIYAAEVERVLRGSEANNFFAAMYGNQPSRWEDDLQGMTRLRVITNYFTRMRFVAKDGAMDFAEKEGVESAPAGMQPWFEYPPESREGKHLLFGHWAALQGRAQTSIATALDTGCVWGGCLTAYRLEDKQIFSVNCGQN